MTERTVSSMPWGLWSRTVDFMSMPQIVAMAAVSTGFSQMIRHRQLHVPDVDLAEFLWLYENITAKLIPPVCLEASAADLKHLQKYDVTEIPPLQLLMLDYPTMQTLEACQRPDVLIMKAKQFLWRPSARALTDTTPKGPRIALLHEQDIDWYPPVGQMQVRHLTYTVPELASPASVVPIGAYCSSLEDAARVQSMASAVLALSVHWSLVSGSFLSGFCSLQRLRIFETGVGHETARLLDLDHLQTLRYIDSDVRLRLGTGVWAALERVECRSLEVSGDPGVQFPKLAFLHVTSSQGLLDITRCQALPLVIISASAGAVHSTFSASACSAAADCPLIRRRQDQTVLIVEPSGQRADQPAHSSEVRPDCSTQADTPERRLHPPQLSFPCQYEMCPHCRDEDEVLIPPQHDVAVVEYGIRPKTVIRAALLKKLLVTARAAQEPDASDTDYLLDVTNCPVLEEVDGRLRFLRALRPLRVAHACNSHEVGNLWKQLHDGSWLFCSCRCRQHAPRSEFDLIKCADFRHLFT